MRNNTRSAKNTTPGHNYLLLKLDGDTLNKDAIGTKVFAYGTGLTQMVEENPVRGYLSTVDKRLHVGFGDKKPDSLKIVWPDGKIQLVNRPPLDTVLQLHYSDAYLESDQPEPLVESLFIDVTQQTKIDFTHKEIFFFDYGVQPLLPQQFSQEGPFISTGDMNGDGLEDFFVGGAFKQSGRIFLHNHDGTFRGKDVATGNNYEEDMQSILFDADGDKDLDLLIAGGSSEFEPTSSFYRPRLYINDGKANFKLNTTAFSSLIRTPAKTMAVADMDGDGDSDIFIGGRVSIGTYPQPPRSYILRNDHGRFVDVTSSVCPQLENIGLINASAWIDIDNDNKPDLVLAADWAPIRIYKNTGATLTDITAQSGLENNSGLWRSLVVTDIDHDGDADIVAGNLGLNNPFHISADQPAEMIAKDFDGNGIMEPVLCYYIKDENGKYQLSSGISRDEWARQMPAFKKRFEQNSSYAKATMDGIFTKDMMANATVLKCHEARSGYFENDGKGKFNFHPFPLQAQEAPVNTIVITDVNHDGITDIIIAGNEYQSNVMQGRYDASYGLLLTGDGKGNFNAVSPAGSGLIIDGDVKDLKLITVNKKKVLLAAVNDSKMKAFAIKNSK